MDNLNSATTSITSISTDATLQANFENTGQVEFAVSSYTTEEGNVNVTVTVNRVNGSVGAISVDYATSDNTAIAGVDYTAKNGTLNWADSETGAKTFNITILEDTDVESTEIVTVTISNPVNCTISNTHPTSIPLNITDNDSSLNTVNYTLLSDWNMISVPFDGISLSDIVDEHTNVMALWQWNNEQGLYEGVLHDGTLTKGRGYFLYLTADSAQMSIEGTFDTEVSISPVTGWNMLGSQQLAEDISVLTSGGRILEWDNANKQYKRPDSNITTPGVGYWIFSF